MTRRKPEEKRLLVDQFENSGMTMREFCARERVSFYTFRGWRQRMKRDTKDQELVEVGRGVKAAGSRGVRVERPSVVRVTIGQATVEVNSPVDEETLETVVRVLERCRC